MYSRYKSFIKYAICKYYLPVSGLSFHFLVALFKKQMFWPAREPGPRAAAAGGTMSGAARR